LAELVAFIARHEGCRLGDVDLAVVDSSLSSQVNRDYLRHAGATDVISFDLSDAGSTGISAQLVICGDVAAAEARSRGIAPQRELMLYVVHGLLHLMGYEDTTIRGAARMRARQEELLDAFMASRPRRRGRR
jgi:probable rRNA maturation factor